LIRRHFLQTLAAASAVAGGAARAQAPARAPRLNPAARPEVFAHRGASALRPEHTLASYAKAIADGADYVEPDLCCTKDGVLVARHEPDISETTDVSRRPEFAARKTTRTLDGQSLTGWFTNDFTLAELKSLRAVERLPLVRPGSARYDGQFQIPTFEEIVDFVAAEAAARERVIGLVPEIKHSTYFAAAGLAMEDRLIAALAAHDYTRRSPIEIQSFEVGNLKVLRRKLGRPANVRLMQLTEAPDNRPADVGPSGPTYGRMTTAEGLREIAAYADVVAPPTRAIIPLGPDGRLARPTALVRDAHAAGLLVHVWTFRPENRFLAADFQDGAGENARNPAGSLAEIRRYLAEGLDGFFTDDPAIGRQAVDRL
jgi:glycerophosphoryl diester phosphodiesterase